MSLEEELVASSLVLADQRERIAELEQLIRELDHYLQDWIPSTYKQGREGMLLKERVREFGIETREAGTSYE